MDGRTTMPTRSNLNGWKLEQILPLAISLFVAMEAVARPELHHVLFTGKGAILGIYDSEAKHTQWAKLGESIGALRLLRYDLFKRQLTVATEGGESVLSRVENGLFTGNYPVGVPPVFSEYDKLDRPLELKSKADFLAKGVGSIKVFWRFVWFCCSLTRRRAE